MNVLIAFHNSSQQPSFELPSPLDIEAGIEAGIGGEVCAKPYFYGNGKKGIVAVIRVMKNGKLLKEARLIIDGTGKMSLRDRRTEPVPAGECKRCGTVLNKKGYCKDETCPHSDHLQNETWVEG